MRAVFGDTAHHFIFKLFRYVENKEAVGESALLVRKDAQGRFDTKRDQLQRRYLSTREWLAVGVTALRARKDAGGGLDTKCDQLQRCHLSMRGGRSVGESKLLARKEGSSEACDLA